MRLKVFTNGVIEKLLIEPGAEVPVGTVLAIIREEGEAPGEELPMVSASPPSPAEISKPTAIIPPAHRVHVSPAAKKLATELVGTSRE